MRRSCPLPSVRGRGTGIFTVEARAGSAADRTIKKRKEKNRRMAKIKPETAYATAEFDGFRGVDTEKRLDGLNAADRMVNFRPTADGSLRKRCGYERMIEFPGTPRAVFSGYLGGEEVLYFLIGGSVFKRFIYDENGYLYVGSVESTEGDAAFAEYLGKLYLFDGTEIYVLEDGVFGSAEGYIPLYGKDWDPLKLGEICEPENLLTRRVRLHYKNPNALDTLYFDQRVLSIHRIFLDGVETAKTDGELLNTGMGCISESFITATEIELLVTLDGSGFRERVSGCRRALMYGEAQDNRLVCWDGEDPNALCCSRSISFDAAEESDSLGNTLGGALYFPHDAPTYRADAPVTAVCRHVDRLLIFSASGVWAADCAENGLTILPVYSSVGCDKKDCAVLCGNTPVSYFGGKLWSWSIKSSLRNEYKAEVFSAPVSDIVSAMRDGAVLLQYYRERSELWLAAAGSGTALIYHTDFKMFYVFDGVYADLLVPTAGEPMMIAGQELYVFNETLSEDPSGVPIRAYYRSGWFDFGHPERTKHLVRFLLEGAPCGGRMTVRFENERGRCTAIDLFGEGETLPNAYDRRASVGRFRYLRASVEASGAARSFVSRLKITARK